MFILMRNMYCLNCIFILIMLYNYLTLTNHIYMYVFFFLLFDFCFFLFTFCLTSNEQYFSYSHIESKFINNKS
jgi:hypothetical protein